MTPKILRYEQGSEGTFGVLIVEGRVFAYTLEPEIPIPAGSYEIKKYNSPRFGEVYKLEDVPDHTYIEIHPGNTIHDTQLCILLGYTIGELNGLKCIQSSRKAVANFNCKMGMKDSILTIIDCF
jgi:hypothetical protein